MILRKHIFIGVLLLIAFSAKAQEDVEEFQKMTYGLTLNGGATLTNSSKNVVSASYGLGAFISIKKSRKIFHIIRLDYNIKQEKFNDITHYRWVDGVLTEGVADIYKNYGIINLNYSFNYYLIENNDVSFFATVGMGINDLFWLKTRVDIPLNEQEITNGKTQFLYTNPLYRPSFNAGVGMLLPYEEDKKIAFKPELNYDYRLPFTKKTYPNFLTYSIRILLFF